MFIRMSQLSPLTDDRTRKNKKIYFILAWSLVRFEMAFTPFRDLLHFGAALASVWRGLSKVNEIEYGRPQNRLKAILK